MKKWDFTNIKSLVRIIPICITKESITISLCNKDVAFLPTQQENRELKIIILTHK